jgi:hypothetical protein
MMKELVFQNSHGAYVGPTPELLAEFGCTEDTPNFDVFDGDCVRLLLGKCSRLADDEDVAAGIYGIDFNRGIPSLKDAMAYADALPLAVKNRDFVGNLAFAAGTEEDYKRKLDVYSRFYSHIYDREPGLVYVAPHCGDVRRPADDLLPFPKHEIDSWTAGIATLCARTHSGKVNRRIMVSIHSFGFPGPVIDVGDFGLLDTARLDSIVRQLENKYHDSLQTHRAKYVQEMTDKSMALRTHIDKEYGTMELDRLQQLSSQDRFRVQYVEKGLQLHGIDVKDQTFDGFRDALSKLSLTEAIGVCNGCLLSGRYVSKQLGLEGKVRSGLLDGAMQIEISRPYAEAEPVLVAQIISELVNEYFFGQEI